jgi:hypothetical protein
MTQYEINIDYHDEPFETDMTLDEIINRDLPAGVTFVRYEWVNPHKPTDVRIIVTATDESLAELAEFAGCDTDDLLTH